MQGQKNIKNHYLFRLSCQSHHQAKSLYIYRERPCMQ